MSTSLLSNAVSISFVNSPLAADVRQRLVEHLVACADENEFNVL